MAGQKQNIMLQHFTWQQFLVAALILSLLWYAGVILIFYRQKFKDLLNGKTRSVNPEPLRHAWDDDYDELPLDEPEDDLLAKQELPAGMSKLSMAQFGFAPAIDEDETGGGKFGKEEQETGAIAEFENDDVQRRGLIPDVMEELKTIFHILERDNGTKEDFISLFALVSSKYQQIRNTPHQRALNEHIRENLLFPISDKELESLWA